MGTGAWREYYRCKFVRSNLCRSRLIVICNPKNDSCGEFDYNVTENKIHSCGDPNTKNIYDFDIPVDIESEMRGFIEKRALEDTGIATDLAKECLEVFCNKYLSKFISFLNIS